MKIFLRGYFFIESLIFIEYERKYIFVNIFVTD